jgi:hypothetical protein
MDLPSLRRKQNTRSVNVKPDSVAGDAPIPRAVSQAIRYNGQILIRGLVNLLELFVKDRAIDHGQALVDVSYVSEIFATIHNCFPEKEVVWSAIRL